MKEIREIAKDIVSGRSPERSAIKEVLAKYLGKKIIKEQLAQGDRVLMGDREGIIVAIDSSDPANPVATVQWMDDNSTSQHPLSSLTPKAPGEVKPADKTSPEEKPVEPPAGEAPKTEQEDDDDDEDDEEDNICPACGGSGRDEEGNECPVCGGSGYAEESVSPKVYRMDHQAIKRSLSKYLTMESTKNSMVYENAFRSLFYEAYDILARASDLYGRYPKSPKISALRTEALNYIADLSALISELYADGYVQENDVRMYFEAMEVGAQTLDAKVRTLADYPEIVPGKGEDEIPPDKEPAK